MLCQTVKVNVGAERPLTTAPIVYLSAPTHPKARLSSKMKEKKDRDCLCMLMFFFFLSHLELFSYQWTAVCLSACLSVLPPVRPTVCLSTTRMVLQRGRCLHSLHWFSKGLLCTTQMHCDVFKGFYIQIGFGIPNYTIYILYIIIYTVYMYIC